MTLLVFEKQLRGLFEATVLWVNSVNHLWV